MDSAAKIRTREKIPGFLFFFIQKVWCDVLICLKDATNKSFPDKSRGVYRACHLMFNNSDEQTQIMKISNTFPSPYTTKNSLFANGGCSMGTAGCANHVDYLGTLYPIYYRRKIIEKRRTLYTKPNWEKTIIQFMLKSVVKFDHYIEYPILFDYDGNVRIDSFKLIDRIRGDGERIATYRVSNF